jgi:hypothetical protein
MVWVLEWAAGCGEGVLQLRQSAVNPLVGAEESSAPTMSLAVPQLQLVQVCLSLGPTL